jgi:hypothetical protein
MGINTEIGVEVSWGFRESKFGNTTVIISENKNRFTKMIDNGQKIQNATKAKS